MPTQNKILLLDDDMVVIEMYRVLLQKLASKPEIHTATTGAKAIDLLETISFDLFICDLQMPKMDGLQVLTIVRRRFPQLRTIVLTGLVDEQFRSRAYALGVDIFWQKPTLRQEFKLLFDCVESLLQPRAEQKGFRGIQRKSLVDLIQLECLTQNSVVLKVIHGPFEGRIWIQEGEIIDAAAEELTGESAFKKILSWKSGSFESLPPDPNRQRTIFTSYQGLLLETVQALDEAMANQPETEIASSTINTLAQYSGVEFALSLHNDPASPIDCLGLENHEPMAQWVRQTMENFNLLGERLRAGSIQHIECVGHQSRVVMAQTGEDKLCVGWRNSISPVQIRESMKKILAQWAS